MEFRKFFADLTGKSIPYPYQERLADLLLAGRSVIFRAPTGAGKTWAAVAPFLYSIVHDNRISDRLLYALPLRTLATTIHSEVLRRTNECGLLGRLEGRIEHRDYSGSAGYCCLQIGGQADDPFFQADLTFTTIDQLLSSYLLHPISLPPMLDNMNAGALIGALLVVDELHLLEPSTALGTTIEMLHRLQCKHQLCQFVLMTATLSDEAVDLIAETLDAERLRISDEEVRALPAQRTKQRTWRWCSEPLTAASVFEEYRGGQAIVLVNTVERAQRIYLELKDQWPEGIPKPELILLHSRFFPDDRKAKERLLRPKLGPDDARGPDVILVTTQVVEAGIDISAELLLTDLAPMNALVQRAGRTARYAPPRNVGTVAVYELEKSEGGGWKLGPYRDERVRINDTRAVLQGLPDAGMVAANSDELAWIETVHGEAERKILCRYRTMGHGHPHRTRVEEAMEEKARSHLRTLVRDISAVNVLITNNPEGVSFAKRRWPLLLSVDPGVVASKLRVRSESNHAPWVAKGARPMDEGESRDLRFQWEEVRGQYALVSEWLIAIHPEHASYDSDHGLVLGQGGPAPRVRYDEVPPRPSYSYRFETWHDHTRAVMEQAAAMARANAVGAAKLAAICGVDVAQVEDWVRLVCALHDLGKLQIAWQKSAWGWQRDRDARQRRPARRAEFIAHTDYDPRMERELQHRRYRLPNHAMEGALAAIPGLMKSLRDSDLGRDYTRDVLVAIVWAVGRHHASRARLTTVPESFPLDADAGNAVATALNVGNFMLADDFRMQRKCRHMMDRDLQESSQLLWPMYCFLARRLRLADQEGTRRGARSATAPPDGLRTLPVHP